MVCSFFVLFVLVLDKSILMVWLLSDFFKELKNWLIGRFIFDLGGWVLVSSLLLENIMFLFFVIM